MMGPGGDLHAVRKSKDGEGTPPNDSPVSNTPICFRMATEEMLGKDTAGASEAGRDSTYGVRSLKDTIYDAPLDTSNKRHSINEEDDESDGFDGKRRSTIKPKPYIRESLGTPSTSGQGPQLHTTDSSPSRPGQQSPPPSMSHSLTSLSLDSQAPLSSFPSSPKSYSNRSFRPSDEDSIDEAGSQAVVSSSDDDVGPTAGPQNSVPQLIMPSIKMPSRRPFTDMGKNMGRLKLLVAGDSGTASRCVC